MELTPDEVELALRTADLALGLLAAAFPGSELCLLRVPSPAALYEFDDGSVSVKTLRGADGFTGAAIRARSERIHGPRDWRHLNRRGQTVLGEAAARVSRSASARA